MRYKPYPAHETEDIVRVADSASLQRGEDGRTVMFVRAECGEMLEIDISDKERPKEFRVRALLSSDRVAAQLHAYLIGYKCEPLRYRLLYDGSALDCIYVLI